MACIFNRYNINYVIISVVLSTFTLTYALPLQANPQLGVGYNEIAFLYRVEKLVKKIWKLEKSNDANKMYSTIIDLKSEIETSCGVTINLDKQLDKVESELQNS